MVLNRATRRAIGAASRHVRRCTKVPARVRQKIDGLFPGSTELLAHRHGKVIGRNGQVSKLEAPAQ